MSHSGRRSGCIVALRKYSSLIKGDVIIRDIEIWRLTGKRSVEPEAAGQKAAALKQQGFSRQKWFPFYGPSHGREGLLRNINLAKSVRQAMGIEGDTCLKNMCPRL